MKNKPEIKTKLTQGDTRKRGEHLFLDVVGIVPHCLTCNCDEDDAFVGGQECSYGQKPDWEP